MIGVQISLGELAEGAIKVILNFKCILAKKAKI
jgi:hypothetical protein